MAGVGLAWLESDVEGPSSKHGAATAEGQRPVPLEWSWSLLRSAQMESFCLKLVLYVVFTGLYATIQQMIRPVSSTFAAQDAILERTARAPLPQLTWERTFYDISSDADWFDWVETALLPSVMGDRYVHGEPGNASMYSVLTVPIRFRQARVSDDSCDTETSALARPCWGDFAVGRQSKESFGEDYGNRYVSGLGSIGDGGLFGYGSEGHVVDVPLDGGGQALDTVRRMKEGLWLNEQTRLVAVETSWYNANLDLSMYCRWQVDISAGGYFRPTVVIYSCRLNPYATKQDTIRLILEGVFLLMFVGYCVEMACDICAAKSAYFLSLFNWLEILNMGLYVLIMLWWIGYLAMDKQPFEAASGATYSERPDLSGVAGHYDFISNMAAFNIVFSFMKVSMYLQVYPPWGLLWRALKLAVMDTWPFLLVFLLFTSGFAFAAHWMFGLMLPEFCAWPASLITLLLSMVGGYPYSDINRVAPLSGPLFTVAWFLIMVMVVANMFVAILVEWYRRVMEERQAEDEKIHRKAGLKRYIFPFHCVCRWLWCCRGGGGYREFALHARELHRLAKRADLRGIESLRRGLVGGEALVAADLSRHWRGDTATAADFAQKAARLQDEGAALALAAGAADCLQAAARRPRPAKWAQILELQATVDRLGSELRNLLSKFEQLA